MFSYKKDYDTVFDYFLDDSIMLIEDLSRCYDIYKEKEKRFLEDFVYLVEKGEVLSKHEQSLIPISDILKLIKSKNLSTLQVWSKELDLSNQMRCISLRHWKRQTLTRISIAWLKISNLTV